MAEYNVYQDAARGAGDLALRLLALVAGVVLMIAGLGMGVSLVLLPIGIPVGLFGLAVLYYALFGWGEKPAAPPMGPK
jgi:hypothetical protein